MPLTFIDFIYLFFFEKKNIEILLSLEMWDI